jgi:uncharacterized secreted protein with C-terminal beta-propeller domain
VTKTVACDRVSHPADFTGTSMLSIYTLDLANLGADPNPLTVAADGDTVYATTTSLYITSNPQWGCCVYGPAVPAAAEKQTTEIHRFDITGSASPTYLGSGEVSGRLLSSYSLSDYQGYLRVAVTNGDNETSNSVIVLGADSLKVAGHVDGLGKGERIYAVRFLGPTAYVVTFRQTDPLYIVDLSKPTAPKVSGELKLNGVSTYLHDAGDGRILGVGQEITDGEGSAAEVSLFDVSDPTKPTRVGHVIDPKTPGPLTFDPHTFLYWQPTGLIVTPVQTWDGVQSGRVFVARVSGHSLTTVGTLANPLTASVPDDGLGIQRSFIVNGALWTISGSGVQVSTETSLSRVAWIPFQ